MPTTATLTEVISVNQEILIQTCIKKLRKNLNTVESMQKIYDIKMKRIIAARGRYRVSMKFYKKNGVDISFLLLSLLLTTRDQLTMIMVRSHLSCVRCAQPSSQLQDRHCSVAM